LAGGLSLGFTAGYVVAKGPEECLRLAEELWEKAKSGALVEKLRASLTGSSADAGSLIRMGSLKSIKKSVPPSAFAEGQIGSGGGELNGAQQSFSPTSSLAESMSTSLPPTPLAGSRAGSDAGRSSSGEGLKMVRGCVVEGGLGRLISTCS